MLLQRPATFSDVIHCLRSSCCCHGCNDLRSDSTCWTELAAIKVNSYAQLLLSDPLLHKAGAILKLDAFPVARRKKSDGVAMDEHDLR